MYVCMYVMHKMTYWYCRTINEFKPKSLNNIHLCCVVYVFTLYLQETLRQVPHKYWLKCVTTPCKNITSVKLAYIMNSTGIFNFGQQANFSTVNEGTMGITGVGAFYTLEAIAVTKPNGSKHWQLLLAIIPRTIFMSHCKSTSDSRYEWCGASLSCLCRHYTAYTFIYSSCQKS